MNIQSKHSAEKLVSATPLFKGEAATATALQILANQTLKEHVTQVPAMLVCISGAVVFENENGEKEGLKTGDYVNIEPHVKHWVVAQSDSQLILLK